MSYSRWKDPRFWPLFQDALLERIPASAKPLSKAREYNFKRYHYRGLAAMSPRRYYARGIADLRVLADLVPGSGFLFGVKPSSCDADIYGFTANIYFYEIDTPLKALLHLPAKPRGAWPGRSMLRSTVNRPALW